MKVNDIREEIKNYEEHILKYENLIHNFYYLELEVISKQIEILKKEIKYRDMALDLVLTNCKCEVCDIKICKNASENNITCREVKRVSIIARAKRNIDLLEECQK